MGLFSMLGFGAKEATTPQSQPSIVEVSNNGVAKAYVENGIVYAEIRDASDAIVVSKVPVYTGATASSRPSIAYDSTRGELAISLVQSNGSGALHLLRESDLGSVANFPVSFCSSSCQTTRVTSKDSNTRIVYGKGTSVYGRVVGSDGTMGPETFLSSRASNPDLANTADGKTVSTYTGTFKPRDPVLGAWGQKVDVSGLTLIKGTEKALPLPTGVAGSQTTANVGVESSSGEIGTVWYDVNGNVARFQRWDSTFATKIGGQTDVVPGGINPKIVSLNGINKFIIFAYKDALNNGCHSLHAVTIEGSSVGTVTEVDSTCGYLPYPIAATKFGNGLAYCITPDVAGKLACGCVGTNGAPVACNSLVPVTSAITSSSSQIVSGFTFVSSSFTAGSVGFIIGEETYTSGADRLTPLGIPTARNVMDTVALLVVAAGKNTTLILDSEAVRITTEAAARGGFNGFTNGATNTIFPKENGFLSCAANLLITCGLAAYTMGQYGPVLVLGADTVVKVVGPMLGKKGEELTSMVFTAGQILYTTAASNDPVATVMGAVAGAKVAQVTYGIGVNFAKAAKEYFSEYVLSENSWVRKTACSAARSTGQWADTVLQGAYHKQTETGRFI